MAARHGRILDELHALIIGDRCTIFARSSTGRTAGHRHDTYDQGRAPLVRRRKVGGAHQPGSNGQWSGLAKFSAEEVRRTEACQISKFWNA